MKKILSFILVTAIFLTMIPAVSAINGYETKTVQLQALTQPVSLNVGNAAGEENTDVVVSVNISANSCLAAADIYLVYDNTKLICKSAVEGIAASGDISSTSINSNFSVVGNSTTIKESIVDIDGITVGGSMMDITFTVLPGWSGESTPLTLSVEDFYDANYQLLALEVENGSVKNTTPVTSTITFNSDGGSPVADLTGTVGDAVTTPENPVKIGYTFIGWNPALPETFTAGGLVVTAKWAALNSVSLYVSNEVGAENTDVVVSVNISENSGMAATDLLIVYDNTKLAFKSAKEGAAAAGGITSVNSVFSVNENFTTIKSAYINNTGINSGGSILDITFTVIPGWSGGSTPLTLNALELVDVNSDPIEHITANGVITNATNATSKVTFNSAGGSAVADLTGNVGDDIAMPANPTKVGYIFTGWYPELPATFPAGGLAVTAQWTARTPVSLNLSSAAGAENSDVFVSVNVSEKSGMAASDLLIEFDNTKLVFKSAKEGAAAAGGITSVNSTFSVNENFTTIKVAYMNINGINDGGSILDITFTVIPGWSGGSTPLTLKALEFVDVNLDPLRYALANGVVTNTTIATSTVTFNSAGGSQVADISGNVGDDIKVPVDPIKAGYVFAGWNPGLPATLPAGGLSVTAQWILRGDVNNNGSITIVDALLTLQQASGFNLLSDSQVLVADVNKDGAINIIDALKMLQYASGILTF